MLSMHRLIDCDYYWPGVYAYVCKIFPCSDYLIFMHNLVILVLCNFNSIFYVMLAELFSLLCSTEDIYTLHIHLLLVKFKVKWI